MNLTSNLQNLEVVDRETEAELLHKREEIINEALSAAVCECRHVPEKEEFLEQFQRIQRRYKFLVLHGETSTGKTVWAKLLFGDPQAVLEVNCASCPGPDLREFRPLLHRGILLTMPLRKWCSGRKTCSKRRRPGAVWVAPSRTATPTMCSSVASP